MFRNLIIALGLIVAVSFVSNTEVWAQAGTAPAPPAEAAAEAPAEAVAPAEAAPAEAAAEAPPAEAAPAEAATAAPAKAAEAPAEAKAEEYPLTDAKPGSYWMPDNAQALNDHVDWMFYAILGLASFCFIAITIAVVYLTWRYRARPGHKAEPSTAHDNFLEVVWTIIPSIICVFIFIGGWKGYLNMTTPPGNAMEINVVGQKWNWTFTYSKDLDVVQRPELHVPVDKAVKLIMRSEDVLHSFYVPSFRVKQDVIPGRYSYLWFKADKPGVYRVYCAEYCGDAHSDMKTKVVVHESGGYDAWFDKAFDEDNKLCAEEFPDDLEKREICHQDKGEKLYTRQGCKTCHSTDGSSGTGPTFQGMWGQPRTFTDGSSGVVDENYVRESLLDPMVKIRTGFNPVMPTFKGKLKDSDIDDLNHWMKSL